MIKQLIFIILLNLFFVFNVKAQNWGGGADDSRLTLGFNFQVVSSELKILKTPTWQNLYKDPNGKEDHNYLTSISPVISKGIGLGGFANLGLNKNLDLRFSPVVVFNDREVLFKYNDNSLIEKRTNVTLTELPLNLKLKSDRLGDIRVYMLGGLKYAFDISSRKGLDKEPELNFKNRYFSYEAGLGLDFYFSTFKFSTELKAAYSLNDVLKHEGNPFDTPIEKAKLRSFIVSFIVQ